MTTPASRRPWSRTLSTWARPTIIIFLSSWMVSVVTALSADSGVRVSFRYIFGIPPLILVLLPVASSDCELEGKEGDYRNILMISINGLDNMIEIGSNCVTNESNFLKKHSCDDNKEAMFLYRAARKLKQFLKMNISEPFGVHLSIVSKGTLDLLNCSSKVKERKLSPSGEAQPTKNLEENKLLKEQKRPNDLCFLRILLDKIKTCWNKILKGAKEP